MALPMNEKKDLTYLMQGAEERAKPLHARRAPTQTPLETLRLYCISCHLSGTFHGKTDDLVRLESTDLRTSEFDPMEMVMWPKCFYKFNERFDKYGEHLLIVEISYTYQENPILENEPRCYQGH